MDTRSKHVPITIAGTYLCIGTLWILFSDTILAALVQDPAWMVRLQNAKGVGFVLVTTGLLYLLLRRGMSRIQQSGEMRWESERQFRQLAEHVQEVFWVTITGQERMAYVSPVYQKIWGRPRDPLFQNVANWPGGVHPEDENRVKSAFPRRAEGLYNQTYRIVRPDGSIRWIRDRAFPIYDEKGKVQRVYGLARDISEQIAVQETMEKRVEERTHEIEKRRQVAEGLRDILTVLNSNKPLDEILDTIVAQAARLLHAEAVAFYRLAENGKTLRIQASQGLDALFVADANIPLGQSVTGLAVQRARPVAQSNVADVLASGDLALDKEREALITRLSQRYRAALAVPLTDKGNTAFGSITLYYLYEREFTGEDIELATAFGDQAALAIENARLRTQVEQAAVAAERSRLARDLHDSVTQILFSASLIAEVLPIVWQRNPQEGQQALAEMRQLTRGALAEMRTLLLELRPAALMEAKLETLLRQLGEAVTGRARVPVAVSVECECTLPPDVHAALYRISQEALNNVAKHAEASQASIDLICNPGEPDGYPSAHLCVCDDGRGFQLEQILPDHLGLSIMKERAEAIGATLTIESRLGQGTQINLTWRGKQRINRDDRNKSNSSIDR